MLVDRDWQTIAGRWFTGAYDELGLDVTLDRIGREPIVTGSTGVASTRGDRPGVRMFGANLPTSVTPADVDFGRGVTVTRVAERDRPTCSTVEVDVAADAPIGARDVFVTGARSRGRASRCTTRSTTSR